MTDSPYITHINVTKLHGIYDLSLELTGGVNVFFGENGTFKTTIANIITLATSGDLHRIGFYKPESIEIEFSDGSKVEGKYRYKNVRDHFHIIDEFRLNGGVPETNDYCTNNEEYSYDRGQHGEYYFPNLVSNVQYYPSFRLLIDTAQNVDERRGRVSKLLGFWIEVLGNQASFIEIMRKLDSQYGEYLQYRDSISTSAIESMTNTGTKNTDLELIDKFNQSVETFLSDDGIPKAELLKHIATALSDLKQSARVEKLHSLDALVININLLLNRKVLSFDSEIEKSNSSDGLICLVVNKTKRIKREDIPRAISAGERQVITLLYQFHLSDENTVLIVDEPEISLDVNWQQSLGKILVNNTAKQAVVFTHSAGFASRFNSKLIGEIVVEGDNIFARRGV